MCLAGIGSFLFLAPRAVARRSGCPRGQPSDPPEHATEQGRTLRRRAPAARGADLAPAPPVSDSSARIKVAPGSGRC